MLRGYSIPDVLRLSWDLLLTRLFFRPARLIRQPTQVRNWQLIQVGPGFTTGRYCRLDAFAYDSQVRPKLVFGRNVEMNDRCHIAAANSVVVGNDVLIASGVYISDHDHGSSGDIENSSRPGDRPLNTAPVRIEDRVWIGENVVILKGVTIGAGSIIGAGAIVTRSIPPSSVAIGCPARVIRTAGAQVGEGHNFPASLG
jgi:acetyltransferase-like isoleucine patch superfamily enzyme